MIAAPLSLVAAMLYAAASVLQHRAAAAAPVERSLRAGLLTHLVVKPWWVAGVAADGLAFIVQFVALGHGPLVVVQPLLVSGLLFALPLGAWVSGRRIHAREMWAGAAVVVGLTALLLSANPANGRDNARSGAWVVLLVATLVPVAVLIAAGERRQAQKAPLLATAAGVLYGLTAALTKTTAHLLGLGVGHVLTSWQPYALIPAGLVGMLVCQSAFQAGSLGESLPLLTAVDPLVSIVIGITAFHEHVSQDPLRVIAEIVGTMVMVGGVAVLGRSPLIVLDEVERSPDAVHDA
jgi:drug/metabolite transporter (DMT)-like permease